VLSGLIDLFQGENMKLSFVNTAEAPKPIGPYAQAVAAGNFLFTSGQIAVDPATGQIKDTSIEEQTKLILKNLQAILKAKGAAFKDVTAATIYLTDLKDFQTENALYAEAMGTHTPARTTVEVSRLPLGAKIEIALIAYLG
jgi:2-iminobutanoate/2-iminopropanoate deaminase